VGGVRIARRGLLRTISKKNDGNCSFCTHVNPGFAGGAYGYVSMGPYSGGQAQYLRVPYADFNALKLPPGTDHEKDFITLADVFPTGWHGVVLSGFQPGESIAVWGAGPVFFPRA
jgi:threonine dehydrogenase-like Zn-dependent dehydrogenase